MSFRFSLLVPALLLLACEGDKSSGPGELDGDNAFEVSEALLVVCDTDDGEHGALLLVSSEPLAECSTSGGLGSPDPCDGISFIFTDPDYCSALEVTGNGDRLSAFFAGIEDEDNLDGVSTATAHLFQFSGECYEEEEEGYEYWVYEGEESDLSGEIRIVEADGSVVEVDLEGVTGELSPTVCRPPG